jgi:hypothetical protein
VTGNFDRFLANAGIRWEHSICDTPQQVGVAEQMNCSIAEGITTILSQSGLTHTWWEDAAAHWLHGKIRLPSSATAPFTPFKLFYGRKPDLSSLRPFGCLAYVHLQGDQRPALLPHTAQCVFIGYPVDYKGWRFWDPQTCKEIISNSAIFQESIFPFHKPGLSGIDKSVDQPPPNRSVPEPATVLFPPLPDHAVPLTEPLVPKAPPPLPIAPAVPNPEPKLDPVTGVLPDPAAWLVTHIQIPPVPPPPLPHDLPEHPHTPPAVRWLTSHFEHHPSLEDPLPAKHASRAQLPGALAEANTVVPASDFAIPLADAVECMLNVSASIELKSLAEALEQPDADKWITVVLAEIEVHLQNGIMCDEDIGS